MSINELGTKAETFFRFGRRFGYGAVLTASSFLLVSGFGAGYFLSEIRNSSKESDSAARILDAKKDLSDLAAKLNESSEDLRVAKRELSNLAASSTAEISSSQEKISELTRQLIERSEQISHLKQERDAIASDLQKAKIRPSTPKNATDNLQTELDKVRYLDWGNYVTLFEGKYIFRSYQGSDPQDYGSCSFELQRTSPADGKRAKAEIVASSDLKPGDSVQMQIEGRQVVLVFSGRGMGQNNEFGCDYRLRKR
ncbi:hypothetical protein RU07_02280 [Agrobacterium tumefaciens]|uniref:Uncharacterized protein n=1 Tax=Agrobacterium tumefaciens TaxID=358 RepID=A0A0D0KYE8_AGRTU|nr:hypothetical protein RU07_02280 [Agrobacterium tumefaciens]